MQKDTSGYSEIYKELANLVGDGAVQKIYKRYSGLTVSFPKRLFSQEFTKIYIAKNKDSQKVSELAHHVQLSERRVRQIIKDLENA